MQNSPQHTVVIAHCDLAPRQVSVLRQSLAGQARVLVLDAHELRDRESVRGRLITLLQQPHTCAVISHAIDRHFDFEPDFSARMKMFPVTKNVTNKDLLGYVRGQISLAR